MSAGSLDSRSPVLSVLFHALRRRWPVAAGLGTLCSAVCIVAVVVLRPPVFTAASLIHVAERRPSLVFETETPRSKADGREFRLAQEQRVKSYEVVKAALESSGLAHGDMLAGQPSPVDWLASSLEVGFSTGTETMEVSLKGQDGRNIGLLVDAVVRAYVDSVADQEQELRHRRLVDLARVYSEKEREVRGKRRQLQEMLIHSGLTVSGNSSSDWQIAMARLTEVHRELLRYGSSLENLKGEIELRQADLADKSQPSISTEELRHLAQADQEVAKLSMELQDIDTAIAHVRSTAALAAVARFEDPYLTRTEHLRTQMDARMVEIKRRALNEKRMAALERIRTLQQEFALTERRVHQLEKAAERWRGQLKQLNPSIGSPESIVETEMLELEIKQLDRVLSMIAEDREKELVELAAEGRVSVIQKAEVSSAKDRTMRFFLAGVTGFAAFFLPVIGIVLWDSRQRLVSSPREISATLGIELLGTVPKLTASHSAIPWPKRNQGQLSLSDATDTITVRLLREAQLEDKRVIAICSAVGDEGRQTLASQIARSLARSDQRTILVDGNLQRPTLHTEFIAPRKPGVTDIVTGSLEVTEVMHETSVSNLWFMPAGLWTQPAHAALANGNFGTLVEELSDLFDFVVLDTGAVLAGIDSRYMCQHTDTVAISVMLDVSRASDLHVARSALESLGIERLSAVVCGATEAEQYDFAAPTAREASPWSG